MPPTLPPTQKRIIALVADGLDVREIASLVGITPNSVQWHFLSLSRLFGTPNHVKWLLALGAWTPGEPDALRGKRFEYGEDCPEPPPQYHGDKCVCCQRAVHGDPVRTGLWTVPMCRRCEEKMDGVRAEAKEREREALEHAEAKISEREQARAGRIKKKKAASKSL